MSLKTLKQSSAGERQNNAAGEVLCHSTLRCHQLWKSEQRDWYTDSESKRNSA